MQAEKQQTNSLKTCEQQKGPQNLNILVVGQVDSGKSSVLIALNRFLSSISEDRRHKECQYYWDKSFTTQDTFRQTHNELGWSIMNLNKKQVAFLEPSTFRMSQSRLMDYMLKSDILMLVVSAKKGQFQCSIQKNGAVQEYISQANQLNKAILVVVTKMGQFWGEKSRFDQIKSEVLKQCKNSQTSIWFVLVDSVQGDNISEPKQVEWWNGPTLIDSIDNLFTQSQMSGQSLRIVVFGVNRHKILKFKVLNRSVKVTDRVQVLPYGKEVTITQIYSDITGEILHEAKVNQLVCIELDGLSLPIERGCVLSPLSSPCLVTRQIKAAVTVLGQIMSAGLQCTLRVHTVCVKATVTKIVAKSQGQQIVRAKFLKKDESGQIVITVKDIIAVEKYQNCRPLGRFILEDQTKVIGYGNILKVKPATTQDIENHTTSMIASQKSVVGQQSKTGASEKLFSVHQEQESDHSASQS